MSGERPLTPSRVHLRLRSRDSRGSFHRSSGPTRHRDRGGVTINGFGAHALTVDLGSVTASRAVALSRWVAYRGYYRLAAENYRRELYARPNRTPAGRFRCYDLLNRHGDDRMLAAVGAHAGPDDVVYDVGANVGVYALALASSEPARRVVAFEPAPPIVRRLRTNVDCNDVGDRIEIRRCGLGDRSGTASFYVSTYPELSAFDRERATRWEAAVQDVVEVPIRRLDDVVDSLPPPDVLKLDVEGAATRVLRGASDTLAATEPTLFVERHEGECSGSGPSDLRSVVEAAGYRIEDRGDFWRCEPDA